MKGIRTAALGAVHEWTAALASRAPDVALGEAEALHDVRVAVRRLRSILRATDRAFAGAAGLEARLQELGQSLSAARDREVLSAGLRRYAATSVPGVLDPASDAAARELRGARSAAVEALASTTFTALVGDLRAFAEDPPPRGEKVTADDILRRDLRRVRRRVNRADEDGIGAEERETRLHDVRKAAKRLRYDLTAFPAGDHAAELRAAAERIQDALGDRRDAYALAELFEGEERGASGPRAQELGRLRRSEQDRAVAALAAYRDALPALARAAGG